MSWIGHLKQKAEENYKLDLLLWTIGAAMSSGKNKPKPPKIPDILR